MSCLKIFARNLSAETQARVGGMSVELDVPIGFSLAKTKNVEQLRATKDIELEGVVRFDLDFTPINDAVFIDYITPQTLDRRVDWIEISIIEDGAGLEFDRMFVIGRDEPREKWVVELARPADHWVELAPGKNINTIDFGQFQTSPQNLDDSWDMPAYEGDYTVFTDEINNANPAYYWPLIDYGAWVDQRPPRFFNEEFFDERMIAWEDLRPLVNFGYLLKRGFQEIGWTLDGLILETEWSRRLWWYLLKSEYYTGNGLYTDTYRVSFGRHARLVGRRFTDQTLTSYNTPILFDTREVDSGTYGLDYQTSGEWLLGIQNPFPYYSQFKFSAQFEITNNNPDPKPAGFVVGEVDDDPDNDKFTGEYLSDFQYFDLGAGTTDLVTMEFEFILKPGQKACILHDAILANGDMILKGLWFKSESMDKCICRYDIVDIRTIMRNDIFLMDMFKQYLNLIQGRYVTDYVEKRLTVYPRRTVDVFGELVPGFINDSGVSINLDNVLVKDSVKIQYTRKNLPRYFRFQWASSSNAYVDDLELEEPAGSRKITNGFDLPDRIDEIEAPVSEPVLEGQPLQENGLRPVGRAPFPFIPRLWDNTDGERSFDIGPTLFFAYGRVAQLNPAANELTLQGGQHAAFLFNGYINPQDAVTEFAYVTQARTWELDPTPTIDSFLVWGSKPNDIFSTFYLGWAQEQRGSAVIDALFLISQNFYRSITFRDLYTFKYLGRPLTLEMLAISDFLACADIPSQLKFLAPPATTDACDGPCSCQYITCEYYQDFGPYMAQNTLIQMDLSSFEVNGIEQLDGPVSFGEIKLVNQGGMPYVMNMVNTLNSLGIPYFYFEPSLRVHPEKGMRYFKLKRPICQSFKIEIMVGINVVYRYTDQIQETNWFGGGFTDFGYGSTFHGTPIDCIQTREY